MSILQKIKTQTEGEKNILIQQRSLFVSQVEEATKNIAFIDEQIILLDTDLVEIEQLVVEKK